MPSFPFLHQFTLVNPYPFKRFLEHGGRCMAAHGFNQLQANQDIQPPTGQVNVGRQVVLFPQLNPVFVSESMFGRHGGQCIANLAISQYALQFSASQTPTRHSETE
jgi:hypothetical protein